MSDAGDRRALRLLDDALARMGSDPCSCSFELLVAEVLVRCDPAPGDRERTERLLRERLGLHAG